MRLLDALILPQQMHAITVKVQDFTTTRPTQQAQRCHKQKFFVSIQTGAEYQSNKLLNARPLMSKTYKTLKTDVNKCCRCTRLQSCKHACVIIICNNNCIVGVFSGRLNYWRTNKGETVQNAAENTIQVSTHHFINDSEY